MWTHDFRRAFTLETSAYLIDGRPVKTKMGTGGPQISCASQTSVDKRRYIQIRDLKIPRRDEPGRLPEVKFTRPGMRRRTLESSLCRPRLVEDVISPVLPSSRRREYCALVYPRKMFQSTLFLVILIRMFLRFIFFVR